MLLLAAAGACGGGSTGPDNSGGTNGGGTNPPPPPGGGSGTTTAAVTVGNNLFSPATANVAPGTVVTWTWASCESDIYGQTCVSHNVTFADGGGTSPVQTTGSFSRTFNTAGTYNYHCSVHGAAMSGKVVVQ